MTTTLEEDLDFLGLPSPEEMLKQHAVLLEHEIEELGAQLRAARESIFKLTKILDQATTERDTAQANLRHFSGRAALLQQRVRDLEDVCQYKDRLNEDLRRQIPDGPVKYLR